MSSPSVRWPVRVLPGEGRAGEAHFHLLFALPETISLSVPLSGNSDGYCEAALVSSCCYGRVAFEPGRGLTEDGRHFCVRCSSRLPSLSDTFLPGDVGAHGVEFMHSSLEKLLDELVDPLTVELVLPNLATLVQLSSSLARRATRHSFPERWAYFKLLSNRFGEVDLLRSLDYMPDVSEADLLMERALLAPAAW